MTAALPASTPPRDQLPERARADLRALVCLGVVVVILSHPARPHTETITNIAGEKLDLGGYQLAFEDRFADLSIGDHPGAGKRWFNHTPWGGDFGDAAFAAPGPGGPFANGPDGLTITAHRDAQGKWSSGLISSRDRDGPSGQGYAQQYGYFEIRAKLPSGMGTWPAFWLVGVDKSKASAEIDVVEYYGGFPDGYHAVAHIWRGGKDVLNRDFTIKVPSGSLSERFNTYGVLIKKDTTAFYLNRRKVAEMETPPEYRQPFYILANLALGSGWPTKDLPPAVAMKIAYIRAYRAPGGQP